MKLIANTFPGNALMHSDMGATENHLQYDCRTEAKKCRQCRSAILEDCLVSRNGEEYFHKGCYDRDSERTKN